LALAIFFACFIRKSDDDQQTAEYMDDKTQFDLQEDEEYLQSVQVSPFAHRSETRVNPLEQFQVNFLRNQ
jgi:hypothetical protein